MHSTAVAMPSPLRAAVRNSTTCTTKPTSNHGARYRRLLCALAGPASTAPFRQAPRRHRSTSRRIEQLR
jgi:hypothetical protein